MIVNNKEKVLILALGREITIYDIAKKLLPKDVTSVSPSRIGPLYTAKKELLKEGDIVEVEGKGRSKPVKASIQKYLDIVLRKIEAEKDFRKTNEQLFEEYAPKIGDFLSEEGLLDNEYELSYPFVVFLLVRYLITVGDYFPEPKSKTIFSKFHSFIEPLEDEEKQRL